LIVTSNLSIQFGAKPLFEKVSVKFGEQNRYGLIGANGSGKSTFVKILSGEIEATAGSVSIGANERMAALRQDQFAFETYTVLDTVVMGHSELWRIQQERDRIYALPEMSEEEGLKVADLEVAYAERDGYTAEARAGELLLGAGIPLAQHHGPMSAVAPGWKLRVLLAQALFADPDLLLLDEPTNHLDIDSIRWLEGILNSRESTMIIVSHDRHFLNSVCTHMADLDYGEIRIYPGNYDDYMTASTQARQLLLANNAKKKAQISELQTFVRRFSANASKARQATSRANQIEKIKLEEVKPSSRVYPYIRFEQDKKLYRSVLEATDLCRGYDGKALFKGLNLSINAGERIAVIGQNGIGKTTLLRSLVPDIEIKGLKPNEGKVQWSENVKFGYFSQDHTNDFLSNLTVFDWMRQWMPPGEDEQVVRATLGQLLFSKHDMEKPVNVLSGGEQGRMLFGKLVLQRPNVLALDEPTNHLDMESIESLNSALEKYPGTLIFVSHDREFVSSLASRIIEIKPEGVIDFKDTYENYLMSQGVAC